MTDPRTLWRTLGVLLDPAGVFPAQAPRLPEGAWPALYSLAAGHWVAPALYAALAGRGRLDQLPPEVRGALELLHDLNEARNRRLQAVLRETARLLNRAGIAPLLLKGAIALVPGQYPHAFARVMSDLDLAVAPREAQRAAGVLSAAGYYPAPNIDPAHWPDDFHHLIPLFHPSGDGYVEVHRALFSDPVLHGALPLPQILDRARTLEWEGVRVLIPALEDRLLHNALHWQCQDGGFRLGQRSARVLLEFAQLRTLPGAADLDWPGWLRRLDGPGLGASSELGDAVRGHLLAVRNLFGQPLPAGVRLTGGALGFALRLNHPGLYGWWGGVARSARRLPRLPRRLLTPAWYPEKWRHLRQQWSAARPGPKPPG